MNTWILLRQSVSLSLSGGKPRSLGGIAKFFVGERDIRHGAYRN
jgi:hypothetical protein